MGQDRFPSPDDKPNLHFTNAVLLESFIDESGHFVDDEQVVPFSIGKRFCVDQSLAEKEFFLFFTGLMQQFEFKKVPSSELPPYNVDEVEVGKWPL